jgi:hypothetical protein
MSQYIVFKLNDKITNLPSPRAATSVATRIGALPDRNSATKHCKFVQTDDKAKEINKN